MSSGKLSEDDITLLLGWSGAGRSDEWIARRLAVSASSVAYHRRRNGVHRRRAQVIPERDVTRTGPKRSVRLFTVAEDARITELHAGGASNGAIANDLGRPRSSIYMRLLMLANRAA